MKPASTSLKKIILQVIHGQKRIPMYYLEGQSGDSEIILVDNQGSLQK